MNIKAQKSRSSSSKYCLVRRYWLAGNYIKSDCIVLYSSLSSLSLRHASCYNGGNLTPVATTEGTSATHWLRNALASLRPLRLKHSDTTGNDITANVTSGAPYFLGRCAVFSYLTCF
ncbi:MAG: hypothetical protein HC849_10490 [Oscillatoriales cyanobacterium RU_3_3]|nr:hypothetical protein [Microcoleus sp. SU_5_6]NJM60523.1 hypothetical protein [Oscillatoriales cyanobacterium RU_3_3]NJR24606.1 hypothetical protein [Richelia sp. CSU_2_1]